VQPVFKKRAFKFRFLEKKQLVVVRRGYKDQKIFEKKR
jgi:hypothetical protein